MTMQRHYEPRRLAPSVVRLPRAVRKRQPWCDFELTVALTQDDRYAEAKVIKSWPVDRPDELIVVRNMDTSVSGKQWHWVELVGAKGRAVFDPAASEVKDNPWGLEEWAIVDLGQKAVREGGSDWDCFRFFEGTTPKAVAVDVVGVDVTSPVLCATCNLVNRQYRCAQDPQVFGNSPCRYQLDTPYNPGGCANMTQLRVTFVLDTNDENICNVVGTMSGTATGTYNWQSDPFATPADGLALDLECANIFWSGNCDGSVSIARVRSFE